MRVIVDPAIFDPELGMLIEIVRDAESGEIIGTNSRFPDPEPEPEPEGVE